MSFVASLERSKGALLSASIGALIGLVAFEASLGLALVEPGRVDWVMVAPGDFATHFLGWHLFRADSWRWPLGATRSFIYPIGTSVGLTDSIPLLAIPLKALRMQLAENFQYLGFWLMSSFVLQDMFAALLVRTRTRHVGLHALGAALFVLAPPLLVRNIQEYLRHRLAGRNPAESQALVLQEIRGMRP